jgi:monoamine oxidase
MAIVSRVTWGCEPDAVSMLHAVRYVNAAGGLDRLLDVRGGAQQDRFAAGTQQIAVRMAEELPRRVLLDARVRRVARRGNAGVTVTFSGLGAPPARGGERSDPGNVTGEQRADARFAIVAIPPAHRAEIEFVPALPPEYDRLARHWPQGSLSKAYVAYDKPFWRANGRSGQALSDEGPVFITFDVSPSQDGPGVLLGFADARIFDPLPARQRRDRALSCFAGIFGEAAWNPIDYLDHCWGEEPFAPGGPTAAVPPGSWTGYGRSLRKAVGPIHWAGTETADEWTGFLDGAVRSGKRAAAEVAAVLTR